MKITKAIEDGAQQLNDQVEQVRAEQQDKVRVEWQRTAARAAISDTHTDLSILFEYLFILLWCASVAWFSPSSSFWSYSLLPARLGVNCHREAGAESDITAAVHHTSSGQRRGGGEGG